MIVVVLQVYGTCPDRSGVVAITDLVSGMGRYIVQREVAPKRYKL